MHLLAITPGPSSRAHQGPLRRLWSYDCQNAGDSHLCDDKQCWHRRAVSDLRSINQRNRQPTSGLFILRDPGKPGNRFHRISTRPFHCPAMSRQSRFMPWCGKDSHLTRKRDVLASARQHRQQLLHGPKRVPTFRNN